MLLLSSKAIFINQLEILIISDCHLGKVNHFRKNGINLPVKIEEEDLLTIESLLNSLQPKKVVFLGDLFHSKINQSYVAFGSMIAQFKEIEFMLTKGNHDILADKFYDLMHLRVVPFYEMENIVFSHERIETNQYNIIGHVHPCIYLKGKGRQSLRVPCFYFGKSFGILPSFGSFTGSHAIEPKSDDLVFAVINGKIVKL